MAKTLTLATKFTAIDKFSSVVSKVSKSISRFANKTKADFARLSRATDKFKDNLSGIGSKIGKVTALVGGLAIGSALNLGAEAVINFDKSLTAASAKFGIFDKSSDSFIRLKETAAQLGATTQFSASEAAQGLNFLAAAGFTADAAITSLPDVINLAVAAEIDLGRASDIATDTLGAMGLASKNVAQNQKNLTRVVNVLAATSTGANATMEDLFETVKDGGPAFVDAGGSIEEFAAIAGIMANSGIKGTKAGTAIKSMMLRLQAPTSAITKVMGKMGVNIDDGTGKMKKMSVIVGEIMKATQGYTKIQRNAAFATIFGKNAISGASITMNAGLKDIDAFTNKIMQAGEGMGVAKKMADFMGTGLFGVVASMKSAFESIAITIGDTFSGEIDLAIKKVTGLARSVSAWIKENKSAVKTIVKVAIFIAKLAIGIKVLSIAFAIQKAIVSGAILTTTLFSTVIKTATAIQWLWNAAISANPIGLIIAGVAALIAGIVLLISNWEKIVKWVKESDNWFAKLTRGSINLLIKAFETIGNVIDWLGKKWGQIVKWVSTSDSGFAKFLRATINPLIKAFELLGKAWEKLKEINKFAFDKLFGSTLPEKLTLEQQGLSANKLTDEQKGIATVNADATIEKARIERSEKIEKQSSNLIITNESDKDMFLQGNNSNIILTPNLGF